MTQASTKRGGFWWVCYIAAWAVTLVLMAVALLRIFYHDGTHFLIQLNSFTRYLYLPAYLCLIWAMWMRRWWLAGVTFAVVACHFAWILPDFVRDRRFDPPVKAANAMSESLVVRIAFSNVLGMKRDFSPIWQEIADFDPDVVVTAESSYYTVESLLEFPGLAEFDKPNGSGRLRRGEVVVFSKLPIESERTEFVTDRIVQTIDVDVEGRLLRIVGLHSPRPMPPPAYDFYGYWDLAIPMLTKGDMPTVIVGDFNATQYSLVHKRLKKGGLRSAHEDRGRGFATTWPNGRWALPPIRIDHAFVSPEVECLSIREGQGDGSDHKPIFVEVRLRDQQGANAK
jgi:endonuclease/exonuclease/phosphatase (EEP) superfamily protein YafD